MNEVAPLPKAKKPQQNQTGAGGKVKNAQNFKELYDAISQMGTVRGTQKDYSPEEIIDEIRKIEWLKDQSGRVVKNAPVLRNITRTNGIRDQVTRIINQREKSSIPPEEAASRAPSSRQEERIIKKEKIVKAPTVQEAVAATQEVAEEEGEELREAVESGNTDEVIQAVDQLNNTLTKLADSLDKLPKGTLDADALKPLRDSLGQVKSARSRADGTGTPLDSGSTDGILIAINNNLKALNKTIGSKNILLPKDKNPKEE